MRFSIIIATINRTEENLRLLKSIAAQQYNDIEVIFADQKHPRHGGHRGEGPRDRRTDRLRGAVTPSAGTPEAARRWDADIAIGEGQGLGLPLNFGGLGVGS